MTVIVGYQHEQGVVIGADSAGVAGLDLMIRSDEKVFVNGPFVIGFTSSFRMGQILQYSWHPPARPEGLTDMQYLVGTVVANLRESMKQGGYARIHSGEDDGGTFLLSYRGHLYLVHSDFQIGVPAAGYAAVGCGGQLACGALHALQRQPELSATDRVMAALEAAELHSAGVRRPFRILEQGRA